MFCQMFGKYLVSNNIITEEQLNQILKEQQSKRAKVGTIAVADGYITEQQAEAINHQQVQQDMRFGDIAVEKGYLTALQVEALLAKQGNPFMKFLQAITEELNISVNDVDKYITSFQKTNGFNREEMNALKNDNIASICSLFAYASKPYITNITALVLRNIVRFVGNDFYIGRIEKTDNFSYKCMIGQKIAGDHSIYLAFADDGGDGILEIASGFAGKNYAELDSNCYDAVAEFSNVCSGLFATELSDAGINIDMEPPFIFLNQKATGSAYTIPIYINGKELKLFLAVDSDIILGTERTILEIKKNEGSELQTGSKGSLVIVDDSALIRGMLRDMVEEYGYTVVAEAVNGQEAIDEYKKHKPDVITLDITMPVMDGLEALRQIKEFDPRATAIMVTAAGQQEKVIESLKLGSDGFVVKPFNKDEVITSIDEACGYN